MRSPSLPEKNPDALLRQAICGNKGRFVPCMRSPSLPLLPGQVARLEFCWNFVLIVLVPAALLLGKRTPAALGNID